MERKEITKKLVVILNDKIEIGRAMNAIAHMAIGLSTQIQNEEELRFQDYTSKDGQIYPNISDIPFIVLKGNKTKIKKLRNEIISRDMPHTSFTHTMIGETYIEQHENTNNTHSDEIELFGMCCFGDKGELDGLTKKFSLYK